MAQENLEGKFEFNDKVDNWEFLKNIVFTPIEAISWAAIPAGIGATVIGTPIAYFTGNNDLALGLLSGGLISSFIGVGAIMIIAGASGYDFTPCGGAGNDTIETPLMVCGRYIKEKIIDYKNKKIGK